MLLAQLNKEEKQYFLDLLYQLILIDGDPTQSEMLVFKRLKNEMGEDIHKYKRSNNKKEKIIEYFKDKSQAIKNLAFFNLISASLHDEWYSAEQHFLLEEIQKEFGISEKKRSEIMRIVYTERDLREKIRRIIAD